MKILAVRYAIFIKRFRQDETITLAKDVNDKTVAAIKENNNELRVLILWKILCVYIRRVSILHI